MYKNGKQGNIDSTEQDSSHPPRDGLDPKLRAYLVRRRQVLLAELQSLEDILEVRQSKRRVVTSETK